MIFISKQNIRQMFCRHFKKKVAVISGHPSSLPSVTRIVMMSMMLKIIGAKSSPFVFGSYQLVGQGSI